ncbi:uncharacterized protein LOC110185960 [Drosophila serrata]|uniref:uncharacterized protein LOC110185960 n=1 Tax=Drosophila serrata TaxID=7274 RepID=UPI000A1D2DEF|nr:uncharacterized protein LOC110185960 [Drosophila serrata]
MSVQKSVRGSRRTRRSVGSLDLNHYIYCINFYDDGLKAVRDEFMKRVVSGTRRAVFVIDLDKEVEEATNLSLRMSRAKPGSTTLPFDKLSVALMRIRDCVAEYEKVTRTIEAESNFDLHNYWQRNIPAQLKNLTAGATKKKGVAESSREPATAKPKTGKGTSDKVRMTKISCVSVTAKEHNKVGKGVPASKRVYIRDNPAFAKIMILIIGNMDNEFYKMLLGYEQPLRAIVHFLPEESAYDLLVPRPRRVQQLQETLVGIQRGIHALRKRTAVKPVGIFQQQLPQMSACMASRFTDDVFDQLSWYMYDVETLREWYRSYYVEPYNEINVKMNPQLSMVGTFHMVESLSIQGHYLKSQMPSSRADDATIYLYLESLMSTFGNPRELMTEAEVLLLANPTPSVQTRVLDKVKVYANAFKSLVKLAKSERIFAEQAKNERIFVEKANKLLTNIISYMDQSVLQNVYCSCLEYNLLRRYFTTGYINHSLTILPYNGELEPICLPNYAELFLTDDSVMQRVIQLVNDYDDFSVEEMRPNVRLYTFRRTLNEVFENEKQIVIPTRLCFRDFTLYEMDQFLNDLVTPKMFNDMNGSFISGDNQSLYAVTNDTDTIMVACSEENDRVAIDPKVFVRPRSIKSKQSKNKQTDNEDDRSVSQKASIQSTRTKRISSKSNNSATRLVRTSGTPAKDIQGTDSKSFQVGLRRDHPMLKGYNLDDTRQTIKCKTSKYFFEEGRMVLYEEKWNFRQMNKTLLLEIDGQEVHFRSAAGPVDALATDGCVRIESKNGISVRALANESECSKAVLNFPNGLNTFCQDTHVELLWQYQENELNESRRVCTPYGCVIVFYQNTDTVVIMRYNGEVYYLYSSTEADNEEEEDQNSEFLNACSTQSTYSSYHPLSSEGKKKRCRQVKSKKSSTFRESGGADTDPKPTNQSLGPKKSQNSRISKETLVGSRKKTTFKTKQAAALFASIQFEMNFLKLIMDKYKISYRHLKLITSLGSVVHVQQDGKIWCGKPFRNSEWHDYFANESYSMRDDGVKMIWTLEELRCYHNDGTVITSATIDGWDCGTEVDEIDLEISSSSSHLNTDTFGTKHRELFYINSPTGLSMDRGPIKPPDADLVSEYFSTKSVIASKFQSVTDKVVEEEEGEIIHDMSFITYMLSSVFIHHRVYPGIQFSITYATDLNLSMETTIFTCDNMRVHIFKDHSEREVQQCVQDTDIQSSEADSDEWTKPGMRKTSIISAASEELPLSGEEESVVIDPTVVEIECNNLMLTILKNQATIQTQIQKPGCHENAKCGFALLQDDVKLKVNFDQSLAVTFRSWVNEVTSFITCFCPKWRTKYFVETQNSQCQKKGFELFTSVPPLGKYNFCAGNYYIDVTELTSVNSQLKNNYDWVDKDMNKFPRFPLYKKDPPPFEFPLILNARIFAKIPAKLGNTDRLHQFVSEFDTIKFKKQRYRLNKAVLFHLHPRLALMVQAEISKRSWKSRHAEHRRRLFMEQQRLSLYMAMLKHKVYPNYFQFKDQFYSHVRNIDFFEFMTSKCNENVHPKETELERVEPPEPPSPPKKPKHKNRKKCVCPKFLNSIE